jgi:hypothetical protein
MNRSDRVVLIFVVCLAVQVGSTLASWAHSAFARNDVAIKAALK